MRWAFLLLPFALIAFLVAALSYREAEPEPITANKVAGDEALPEKDPIAFLETCLAHYEREVHGYSAIFHKQEKIGGRMQSPEQIQIYFREKPFSVYFEWLKGARKAERALYVEGENDGMFLARPNGYAARFIAGNIAKRELDSADAKASSRYSFRDFGLKKTMARTLASWKRAQAKNALHVKYLGVHTLKEVDNRECYTLRRAPYDTPEEDGITELTVYIDKKTLLQVGTVVRGADGKRIASYFFRDLHLNPKIDKDYFQRAALIP